MRDAYEQGVLTGWDGLTTRVRTLDPLGEKNGGSSGSRHLTDDTWTRGGRRGAKAVGAIEGPGSALNQSSALI